MIDRWNELAKSFRRVRDFVMNDATSNVSLRLLRHRSKDARVYNLPTTNEVAALIVGDLGNTDVKRDIIVKKGSGELQMLHETYTSFIPLQYPLILPYGEYGYKEDILISHIKDDFEIRVRGRVSFWEWIAFRVQERHAEFGNIVNSLILFQQFLVKCYTMIEAQRLSFIRNNQQTIRREV